MKFQNLTFKVTLAQYKQDSTENYFKGKNKPVNLTLADEIPVNFLKNWIMSMLESILPFLLSIFSSINGILLKRGKKID